MVRSGQIAHDPRQRLRTDEYAKTDIVDKKDLRVMLNAVTISIEPQMETRVTLHV
jgi:hypothetical protein